VFFWCSLASLLPRSANLAGAWPRRDRKEEPFLGCSARAVLLRGGAMSSAAAAGEAAYSGGAQKGALQQRQPQQPGPGALLYAHNGAAVYRKPAIPPFYQQPAASNAAAQAAPTHSPGSAEPLKLKRGRPRKYGPADGPPPLAVVSPSQKAPAPADVGTDSGASPMLPPGFSPSQQGGGVVSPQASPAAPPPLTASNASSAKKKGRPLGSTSKKPQPQAAAPGNVLASLFSWSKQQ